MATKSKNKASKKNGEKGRVKTLSLKRESLKDVSGREQKRIKGGGGQGGISGSLGSHVVQGEISVSSNSRTAG